MRNDLHDAISAVLRIIPEREEGLIKALESKKLIMINESHRETSELANEIFWIVCHYIPLQKKNWQRKIFNILLGYEKFEKCIYN